MRVCGCLLWVEERKSREAQEAEEGKMCEGRQGAPSEERSTVSRSRSGSLWGWCRRRGVISKASQRVGTVAECEFVVVGLDLSVFLGEDTHKTLRDDGLAMGKHPPALSVFLRRL